MVRLVYVRPLTDKQGVALGFPPETWRGKWFWFWYWSPSWAVWARWVRRRVTRRFRRA
jgi:hypothetical protein